MKMVYCLFYTTPDNGSDDSWTALVGVYSEIALAETALLEQTRSELYHIEEWELDMPAEEVP